MSLDVSRFLEAPVPILAAALALDHRQGRDRLRPARPFGLDAGVAAETGLLLGPGGEFGLVILGAAMAGGLFPADRPEPPPRHDPDDDRDPGASPASAAASAASSPSARPLDPAVSEPPPDEAGRVIIAGYGRVGQLVGEMLDRHKVPYLAIDLDPARVAAERGSRQAGLFRRRLASRIPARLRHRPGPRPRRHAR